jgi:hypothetical protein
MATRVVIVGDLPEHPDRASLVRALTEGHPNIHWDWLQAEGAQCSVPQKYMNRLLHELRNPNPDITVRVVRLRMLNGKDAHSVHRLHRDPILPPADRASAGELVEWLLSAASGLIPPNAWQLPLRHAAVLAVLSKLVRNKAWNKDKQGHAWVKENDLLGQAPVNRPSHPRVYGEACDCMERFFTAGLLLTKGGKQGKTPKEWSVNTEYLPAVKRSICDRNLDPLRAEASLAAFMIYIDGGPNESVVIDDVIVSERVLSVCRERRD